MDGTAYGVVFTLVFLFIIISVFFPFSRMRSCENAIGLMKNLQSSVQVEESWVDGTTERLSAMPTATSAYELDVSICVKNIFLAISTFLIFPLRFQ